ncbi:patatin-like protein [Derxia gummosa]|uniref:Patatin-like protein n=1 Tax=Derxia gummosa DSM 723 TaxID=1121388 RepID=A0A8B6X176_9BURK|nr:patatin-like protein [Derxia gummosa]
MTIATTAPVGASVPLTAPPGLVEELRFAVAMNGGVSLCIWIGGVATEINRLTRSNPQHDEPACDVYRDLLCLLGYEARVDVISGTSAGGINGAALGIGAVYRCGIDTLRDVWLDSGSLTDLLRDPATPAPPSLLDGNDYFLPRIKTAFENLIGGRAAAPAIEAPLSLTLTTTLLDGELVRQADDLGSTIFDVNHRGRFHFVHGASIDNRHDVVPMASFDGDSGAVARRLARAARATASFPAAFEPFLTGADDRLAQPASVEARLRATDPDMTSKPRYVIDGGVLNNKPIESALAAIMTMPADRPVRRVFLYVIPDPSASVRERAPGDQPSIGAVALDALVGIPGNQVISEQLAQIRDHNAAVRNYRSKIDILVEKADAGTVIGLARTVWPTYLEDRAARRASAVIAALAASDAFVGDPTTPGLAQSTRDWLEQLWRGRVAPIAAHEDDAVGLPSDSPPSDTTSADSPPAGADFRAPRLPRDLDLHLRTSLLARLRSLMRKTLRSIHLCDERRLGTADNSDLSIAHDAITRLDQQLRSSAWTTTRHCRDVLKKAVAPDGPSRAAAIAASLARVTSAADVSGHCVEQLVAQLRELATALDKPDTPAGPDKPDTAADFLTTFDSGLAALGRVMKSMLDILRGKRLLDAGADTEDARIAATLQRAHAYTFGAAAHLDGWDGPTRRLIALHVLSTVFGDGQDSDATGAVELVQVSARFDRDAWGNTGAGVLSPEAKVAGMQLAHFGAFYRRSWRANDWMHGRLDAIDRLVRAVLVPRRLARLYPGRAREVAAALADLATRDSTLAPDALPELVEADRERRRAALTTQIHAELRFLDDSRVLPPAELRTSADALIRQLQLRVMRAEMPDVVQALRADRAAGADPRPPASVLLATWDPHLDATRLVRLVQACALGREGIGSQFGSDLMTATLGKTVAVVHAAASGPHLGVDPVAALLKTLKLPVTLFYWASRDLSRGSSTASALRLLILALGVTLVITAGLGDGLKSPLLGLGWSLTAVGALMLLLRGGGLATGPGQLTAVTVLLALLIAGVASGLPPMALGLLLVAGWLMARTGCRRVAVSAAGAPAGTPGWRARIARCRAALARCLRWLATGLCALVAGLRALLLGLLPAAVLLGAMWWSAGAPTDTGPLHQALRALPHTPAELADDIVERTSKSVLDSHPTDIDAAVRLAARTALKEAEVARWRAVLLPTALLLLLTLYLALRDWLASRHRHADPEA